MMELERRVRRLETQNRRLKLSALLLAIGWGSVFLMGQGGAVSGQIKTRHFALVDTSNRPLVQMRPEGPGGVSLILGDNSGAFEIALRARSDRAELELADKKTGARLVLQGTADERRLTFHEAKSVVADLGVDRAGPALTLYGAAGEARVRAGGEGPSLSTTNPQGQPVWRRP